MKRTVSIAAGLVAVAAGATALLPREQQAPRPRAAASTVTTAPAQPAKDVRVRHEFVTLEMPAAAPAIKASATPARIPDAVPARRVPGSRADEPLLSRARRAFLGDGRHRPEPFPRVK